MQSIEITGLKELTAALDAAPGVIREAKAEFFEEAGAQLLADVQSRIGGTGRVAGVQEYRVGSGKGYVAVRAKAKTYLDGYAAGRVTNALESGHVQKPGRFVPEIGTRLKRDRVPGKYMYEMTRDHNSEQLAETGARRIEAAILENLKK